MTKRQYDIILVGLLVLACVLSTALVYLVYDNATTPDPTPIPSPTPVGGTTDAWQRIQATGKMVIGTSADYPPFASINDDFQLDGLDIAIIRELGQLMGVEVDIKDMAFDGLPWALSLGQIDAAIAAISMTPERQQNGDFSNIYFVSDAAVIAQDDSNISTISSPEDMGQYRIGVQRNTVYSNWVQDNLVATGLTPISNVFAYESAESAGRDLLDGRIDLVMLDLPVAQSLLSSGGIKIVGQGLDKQLYAIAMAKGNAALQQQLNTALEQLQSSGRLNELILQYTGSVPPPIPPTPTPPPPPAATATPPPCVDGMQFVADLNLDDNNMTTPPIMAPGQPFIKGWRIRNSGTCTWNSSYRLEYDYGNTPLSSMGGQPTAVQGSVLPGAEYDMYVNLVAPLPADTYQGFWSMRNAQSSPFGDRVWVGITVPAPPTSTPPPTQTPSPSIDFTVDRTQINAGECVVFAWNVQNAQAVYFYRQGEPWQQNQVPSQGSRTECPLVTTTYELRVELTNGAVEVRQITIYVNPVPGAPVIEQFSVNPPFEIFLGQCVDVTWIVSGAVNSIRISRDETILWEAAPLNGNYRDCPPSSGTIIYKIEANGPGGTSRTQHYINVIEPVQPLPTVTPVPSTPQPAPPVINYFTIDPAEIPVGACFNLFWQTSGGTTAVDIARNSDTIIDNGPLNGQEQDCIYDSGLINYRLTAKNSIGQTVFQEVQVNVVSTGSPPLIDTVWNLNFYQDGVNLVTLLPGTSITAVFAADGTLTGSGGCNNYSATYQTSGNTLTIGPVSSSAQSCSSPAGIMEQEQAYFRALPTIYTFDISDTQLRLRNGFGDVALQYTAGPTPR